MNTIRLWPLPPPLVPSRPVLSCLSTFTWILRVLSKRILRNYFPASSILGLVFVLNHHVQNYTLKLPLDSLIKSKLITGMLAVPHCTSESIYGSRFHNLLPTTHHQFRPLPIGMLTTAASHLHPYGQVVLRARRRPSVRPTSPENYQLSTAPCSHLNRGLDCIRPDMLSQSVGNSSQTTELQTHRSFVFLLQMHLWWCPFCCTEHDCQIRACRCQ